MNKQIEMTREDVLDSVIALNTETGVKAWKFKLNEQYYHVCAYHGYQIAPQVSIWHANSSGQRSEEFAFFERPGRDHVGTIGEFLDSLNLTVA